MIQGYSFRHPETDEDYQQLYTVMRRSFPDEDVVSIVKQFREKHDSMSNNDFFMVFYGDEVVAGLVLIPQKWRIDNAELNVAEMGCVGTVPEHRRKGIQWILNEEFDKRATERGADICVLAGIPYFYRQFGYQYAVELDYYTGIDVDKLPTQSQLTRREFSDADIDEAQLLLENTQKGYLVSSIRTPQIWKIQQETGTYGAEPFKTTAVLKGDKMVAYYRWWSSENQFYIKELAQTGEYSEDIAGIIREQANENDCTKITSKLSHEDDFSKYLIGLGAEKNKPYGWQIKILDPKGFLEKLGPVFEKRLTMSEYRGLTKELRLNFWKYKISLDFKDGKLDSVEYIDAATRELGMNPYASIQLFFGFRSRLDLDYAYPDFNIRGGNEELVDVLFPRHPGYIHYCY